MSTSPRLFIDAPLGDNLAVMLSPEQAHYVRDVMRMAEGAKMRAFNGSDGEWLGHVSLQGKKAAQLVCEYQTRAQAPSPDIWLLFAPLKRQRTDMVIEKATELGASLIQPVFTRRTQSDRVRDDRFRLIAIEAAEQTERLDVPMIGEGQTIDRALDCFPPDRILLFADEAGDDPSQAWGGPHGRAQNLADWLLAEKAASPAPRTKLAVLIGPEGGFTPEERSLIRARDFAVAVTLGPRILRAETAALAALACLQALVGDWGHQPRFTKR